MATFSWRKRAEPSLPHPELLFLLSVLCVCVTARPHGDGCPSAGWSAMCRPCCEYQLIQCLCPSKGSKVGYTVPCCRNALDQCDPCIIHPGCSLFENCKTCNNGTWRANDDFFINGKFCTECRQGWSGGDCRTCGGVIQRSQGHIALESYPTNGRCEWVVRVERGSSVELRFTKLSLEADHNCGYDYVEVRDGDHLNSPVIGRYCGDQLPPPMKSSGNVLHVLFSSDGYNNFNGFVLTFQQSSVSAVKTPSCAPPQRPLNGYLLPVYSLKEQLVSLNYGCHSPFTLLGCQQRTCLPGGTWSGTAPTCVRGQTSSVPCPPPPKLLNGYHRPAPDSAGGAQTVEFFCKKSYVLSGNQQSSCRPDGTWSGSAPKCVRVPTACREPKVSDLVRQSVVKPRQISRYNMDDLLSAGFIPLTFDKHSKEEDVPAVDLPRGFHPVYTSIEYRCASPFYKNTGSSRRTCLKTGRWSGRHVSCSPVCGKVNTPDTHNLTDAQWPWHVAIYVRSPPDHTPGSHRPRGRTVSSQQGASEESTSWSVACSGALLTQRSVLAAAQCVADKDTLQTLHPAHVKVVLGVQHQGSSTRLKGLHHLRVSDILVSGSAVAVLKLKDKARISERVLPVCLPRGQGGEVTVQEAYTARWILPKDRTHLTSFAPRSQTRHVELGDVAQCEEAFVEGGARNATVRDDNLCVIRKPSSPQIPCPTVIPGITVAPAVFPPAGRDSSGQEETSGSPSTNWQLLGLEGFDSECHQQTYWAQTRVASFLDWIEKNMK